MFLIDSHCHLGKLDYHTLHKSANDVIEKAKTRDVKLILSVCTTLQELNDITKTIGWRHDVLFSCGIHPLNLDKSYNSSELYHLAANKEVIALGETGLDYYRSDNKEKQKDAFREHIRVSIYHNKPIIIHTRNSYKDILTILHEEQSKKCKGVLHCFTEDKEVAYQFLKLGFYISFSGIITFKNSETLRNVVRYIPLDHLLIETDSPYLAPVPYRGKENQPSYLHDIAKYMAVLKNISLEKLAYITTNNFFRLFNVDTKYRIFASSSRN